MIAWGWQHETRRQQLWARQLHTTSQGTAISDMVRVVNHSTGFDRPSRAGRYIVLDISDLEASGKWLLLQMRHIVDYRAPLVLHPVLLKRYYPYLDDDASGHFQVGRGYDKQRRQAGHARLLRAVEPAALRPLGALHQPASSGATPTRATAPTGPLPAEHRGLMRRAPWAATAACVLAADPRRLRGRRRAPARTRPSSSAPTEQPARLARRRRPRRRPTAVGGHRRDPAPAEDDRRPARLVAGAGIGRRHRRRSAGRGR